MCACVVSTDVHVAVANVPVARVMVLPWLLLRDC